MDTQVSSQKYNILLSNYIRNTILLAGSVQIKYDIIARFINKQLSYVHPGMIISDDKKTWKYYMHMCGIYHTTDTPMTCRSLDTYEEVQFTREELSIHVKTREGYQFGNYYYKKLIAKYPEQITLILGILYPGDIDKVTELEDGSISSYNTELVKDNEFNLISDINNFTVNWIHRFFVPAYVLTDDLYPSTMMGVLSAFIPTVILNSRLKYARTEEAHIFHVDMGLGNYFRVYEDTIGIDDEKKRWLYRNMEYVYSRIGTHSTDELVKEKLISNSLINSNKVLYTQSSTSTTNDLPSTLFKKGSFTGDSISTDSIIDLSKGNHFNEVMGGSFNVGHIEKELSKILYLQHGNDSRINLIETDNHYNILPFLPIAMEQWVIHTSIGTLSNITYLDYNGTGYSLDHTDMYMIFWYLTNKVNNIDTNIVPSIYVRTRLSNDVPDISILDGMVSTDVKELLASIIDTIPIYTTFISTSSFNEYVTSIYNSMLKQKLLLQTLSEVDRLLVEGFLYRLYTHQEIDFNYKYNSYDQFFNITREELSWVKELSISDSMILIEYIVNEVLGIDLSSDSSSIDSIEYIYDNIFNASTNNISIPHSDDVKHICIQSPIVSQPFYNDIINFHNGTPTGDNVKANSEQVYYGITYLKNNNITIKDVYS